MCNCILWVRRRLLALLLIIGCMAVSATASATVCFLPDAEDCGLSSASDGNSVCDGSTTYASVTDCNNSITLHNNSQYCEKDGACYRRYCKYPTQSDCEAGVKDYTHKYDHFFCVYDSSTSCYDLQNTPCIEKTTKTGCDGYKLDAPTEGKTCGSCSQRVVTETCSAEGLPGETDEYKTVYDCVEPKYQQIGCDSFDKTETEKNTLEAAPNNYHCTSCTKTNQKQDYEGHWNDYGKGDTMYKCKPTCATYGLVTSCSQGSGEAGTIAFVEDTKGRTNYDGKKCGTCGCTPKPCTGFDYTEDTLSDKSNATSCDLGCDKGKKWKCNTEYKYDSSTKSCIQNEKTCEQWVAENFPDFSIVKSNLYSNVTGKTLLLNDLSMTTSANVNGGTLVGPKYFNYDKCQALDTPTISVTSKLTPAVTLTDGTISDLNIHFDQVVYKYDGYITEACSFYEDCISGNYTYQFYDYVRSNGFNCPDSFSAEVEGDDELLCRAYNLIKSDYNNNCYDPYNTLLYNYHQLKECSDSYDNDCSCTKANSTVCKAMNYAHNYCANNTHSAVEGYGKMHNISISTKPDTNVAGLINNKGGVLTLSGNNNFVASTGYDKNSFGVFARNVIIADGTTRVYSGRGFSLYNYDSKAELTINKDATLIIEYADFNGLDMTWGGTANIYGKLKISSWGSGGKYNNDIATDKGIINAKSTSCIIIPNGASGTGGYTGTVNSGTLNFATGAQLKIRGTCKKATTSGSAVIKDRDKPNNLYGDFTSHPSGFTASCDASCN